jgi:hypothetical protein
MKYLKSHGVTAIGILMLVCLSSCPLFADSLVLRNGEHVEGKFAGGTQGVIAFVTDRGTVYYNVSDVLAMTFEAEEGGSYNGSGISPNLPSSGQSLRPQAGIQPKPSNQSNRLRRSQQTSTRKACSQSRRGELRSKRS